MKKVIITACLLLLLTVLANAQALTPPEFPGGKRAYHDFLTKNLKWPDKETVQGIVVIGFYVERDGRLTNIRVVRSLSPVFDREALRVMSLSPRWTPAMENKRFIKSAYTAPISFELKETIQPEPIANTQSPAQHITDISIEAPISAQEVPDAAADKIFATAAKDPEFPGGSEKFEDYIRESLRKEKLDAKDFGRVIVSFIVERDGSLTSVKVVKGGTENGNAVAIKLIKSSPKWLPGIVMNRPVRVAYAVPVNLKSNI